MKIVVAQYYTSNLNHGKYAEAINRKYCEEQNYEYYVEKDDTKILDRLNGRAPTWYKPFLIRDIFQNYDCDYVLFLDTDAIISDFNRRIEEFIDLDYNFIISKDVSVHSKVNGGVFFIKKCDWSEEFLNDWWDLAENTTPDKLKNLSYSENDINDGTYFRNRLWMDQSILTYIYENIEKYSKYMLIVDDRYINHPKYNDGNFIFHAYAYGSYPYRRLNIIHDDIFNIKHDIDDNNLLDLVKYYNTDKHYTHNYFNEIYNDLFKPLQLTTKKFVELGVHEGESIKIWQKYFKNSTIIGLDLSENYNLFEDKDRIVLNSINSGIKDTLIDFANKHDDIDIFMDDGSHIMYDQQITLATIFKSIKSKGMFIVEDLHTSGSVLYNDESIWGTKDNITTLELLENFIETKKIKSEFLTDEECEYLENNISEIKIYKLQPHWSWLAIIYKK